MVAGRSPHRTGHQPGSSHPSPRFLSAADPVAGSPGLRGVGAALIGFAVGYILSAVCVAAVSPSTGYHGRSGEPIPLPVLAASVLGLWVGLVATVVKVSRDQGDAGVVHDFGLRIGAWWDLPVGAAVGLASQYGLVRLVYLPFEAYDHGLAHQISQPAQNDTSAVHTAPELAVALLLLAVGAPIVEELFFRGLLLRSLRTAIGGWRPHLAVAFSVVISALCFALAHFEPVQFLGLACFGVVLALMAWRWDRLGPSIAAHAAFNASAVISITHLR
jgi:membrane protease YdiL (CAAX protease family)